MKKTNLRYMYDVVWSGKHNDFKSFYEDTEPKMEAQDILEICRYAFSYYLKWNPDAVYAHLDEGVLRRIKLYNLVMKIYPFPTELDDASKIRYFIGMLYPQYYKFDKEEATRETFRKINENEIEKLPNKFFSNSAEGKERAKICFRYLVNNYYMFNSYEEMFAFFSSAPGRKFLSKYHIKLPVRFFGSAADMIYEAFADLDITEEEREECILWREKYKSMFYMDRYARGYRRLGKEKTPDQEEQQDAG